MRLPLPKSLLLPALAMSVLSLSCDQDLVSSADQPDVDYILLVTDSATSAPLGDVEVRVTTRNGDTATYQSDSEEGRVEMATVASSQTLFRLSKAGYRTRDVVDTVNAKPDTVFHRAIQKVLRIRMLDLNGDSGRVQVKLLLRNEDLDWLRKGQAEYLDSLGLKRVVTDHDSDGTLALAGLAKGSTVVTVKHPAYLGRLTEVMVVADTGKAEAITVILKDLKSSISGQVYIKTATGSRALPDAKVEFHVKDSSAVPKYFRGYTSADAAQDGRFNLSAVPALDGEMRYYKDRSSGEPAKVVPVTKEEVMQDGALPRVILTVLADSLSPLLLSGPGKALPGNDTVGAKDTLRFKFNQAVEDEEAVRVKLINGSEVLTGKGWSEDKTLLKIWQKEADWSEGKKYEYVLILANAQGEIFSIPGDSAQGVSGTFVVRAAPQSADSALLLPRNIKLAYFNSGNFYQFGPADTNTSPKADSSSQFARLRLDWETGAGRRRPDSLEIWYKDNQSAQSWALWGTTPGFQDSLTLSFSDRYSTFQVPSDDHPRFPLRDSGGQIQFRIFPKHAGKRVETWDTTLAAFGQGMGPSVYVQYVRKDSLGIHGGAKDTVKVKFTRTAAENGDVYSWGDTASWPDPKLYFNGKEAPPELEWELLDDEEGLLIYTLPSTVTSTSELRADLNGVLFHGKPVWQRNAGRKMVLKN